MPVRAAGSCEIGVGVLRRPTAPTAARRLDCATLRSWQWDNGVASDVRRGAVSETGPVARAHIARVNAAAIELVRTAALLIEATAGPAERDWFLAQLSQELASVIATAAGEGPDAAQAELRQDGER